MKLEKPFYTSVTVLMIGGLLPMDFKKSSLRFFFVQNCIYKVLFSFTNCIAPTLHVIYFRGNTNYDSTDDLSEVLAGLSFVILDILFAAKWKQWFILLEDMSKDTEFGKHPDFHRLAKRLNIFSLVYTLSSLLAILFYSITLFFRSLSCKKDNRVNDLNVICNEFTPAWLIIDEPSIAVSLTFFVFQTTICIFMGSCALTSFLVYEATEVIVSHVDNLKKHFVEVFDVPDKTTVSERFRFCVRYHNYILELGNRFSNLCKFTSGVVTLFCALCLSNLGNQISNDNSWGTMLYLFVYTWAVFLLCHSGQNIKDQTYSLKDVVYSSKWYDADIAIMKDVMFVIARCQKPVCLETLPIGILEYPLFLLIIKTTYSYLTLLSQKQA